VLRAVSHLHMRNIIYRDLKPQNLLLHATGYCKLTDFGLSKLVVGRTTTICGTPEYFAPEMVAGSSHTKAVDWWAFGVLAFELMTGRTPFEAADTGDVFKLFAKIKIGLKIVTFPPGELAWADLVRALCKQDPSERLPVRPRGVRNVEDHRWYAEQGFNWQALNEHTMEPPFVPGVKAEDLLGNFFTCPLDNKPPFVPAGSWGSGWDRGFEDPWGPASLE